MIQRLAAKAIKGLVRLSRLQIETRPPARAERLGNGGTLPTGEFEAWWRERR